MEILESLGISNKEITRKCHNLRSQMCAEARKLKQKRKEEEIFLRRANILQELKKVRT